MVRLTCDVADISTRALGDPGLCTCQAKGAQGRLSGEAEKLDKGTHAKDM